MRFHREIASPTVRNRLVGCPGERDSLFDSAEKFIVWMNDELAKGATAFL